MLGWERPARLLSALFPLLCREGASLTLPYHSDTGAQSWFPKGLGWLVPRAQGKLWEVLATLITAEPSGTR